MLGHWSVHVDDSLLYCTYTSPHRFANTAATQQGLCRNAALSSSKKAGKNLNLAESAAQREGLASVYITKTVLSDHASVYRMTVNEPRTVFAGGLQVAAPEADGALGDARSSHYVPANTAATPGTLSFKAPGAGRSPSPASAAPDLALFRSPAPTRGHAALPDARGGRALTVAGAAQRGRLAPHVQPVQAAAAPPRGGQGRHHGGDLGRSAAAPRRTPAAAERAAMRIGQTRPGGAAPPPRPRAAAGGGRRRGTRMCVEPGERPAASADSRAAPSRPTRMRRARVRAFAFRRFSHRWRLLQVGTARGSG